jgi:hypothetical protein
MASPAELDHKLDNHRNTIEHEPESALLIDFGRILLFPPMSTPTPFPSASASTTPPVSAPQSPSSPPHHVDIKLKSTLHSEGLSEKELLRTEHPFKSYFIQAETLKYEKTWDINYHKVTTCFEELFKAILLLDDDWEQAFLDPIKRVSEDEVFLSLVNLYSKGCEKYESERYQPIVLMINHIFDLLEKDTRGNKDHIRLCAVDRSHTHTHEGFMNTERTSDAGPSESKSRLIF